MLTSITKAEEELSDVFTVNCRQTDLDEFCCFKNIYFSLKLKNYNSDSPILMKLHVFEYILPIRF